MVGLLTPERPDDVPLLRPDRPAAAPVQLTTGGGGGGGGGGGRGVPAKQDKTLVLKGKTGYMYFFFIKL